MWPEQAEGEEPACCPSCGCCRRGPRSLKRKLDSMAEARVEAEDEVAALREAVEGHQQTVELLCVELEEERAAAASAASEAMSMILRLQRDKGEALMEARQFRRFAEEKMEHDRRELLALEDMVYERERTIEALYGEVRAYRDRLLSHGIAPDCLEAAADSAALEDGDGERPASPAPLAVGLARGMEQSPSQSGSVVDELEKEVVMGQSPQVLPGEPMCSVEQPEEFQSLDCEGDDDDDSTSDRVYTVDAVHSGAAMLVGGIGEDYADPTNERVCTVDRSCGEEDVNIRKLDMRLQALEAERESMRRAIVSMQADKAQLLLLKEIAQQLCKDVSANPPPPERKLVNRPFLLWGFSFMSTIKAAIRASILGSFSVMSTIKWILSFVVWKKNTDQSSPSCRYTFGLSNNNVGLLLLLDNAPRIRQLRCHSRTGVSV